MIQLIRVYRDERVIHAETYDSDEYPPPLPEHLRCRCLPTPVWRIRELNLRQEFRDDTVTSTPIYRAGEKQKTP